MMKILFASSSPNSIRKASLLFDSHEVHYVETGKEILNLLSKNNNYYSCLISEFVLNDLDIWHISLFIKNNITNDKGEKLPVFVIEDEKEDHPSLLKADYQLQTLDLFSIVDVDRFISNPEINKASILIVEDDELIAKAMKIALKDTYLVDVRYNKKEGVECFVNKKHDLVLLDLMLPMGSGEEVLSEIRAINLKQEIIIVSARTEIEIQEKYTLLGVSDYLTKPFKPNKLLHVCRVVLTQSALKYDIERKDKLFKVVSNTIFSAVDLLENGDIELAIDSLNKVASSIGYKGEDSSLKNILSAQQ